MKKREDHLWLEEWIKSIQVSVNSKHKRTEGIVAREEAREEEAGGQVRSGSLHHSSSTSKNDCREWDPWLKLVHCVLQMKLPFLHTLIPL